jgi:hypothetical protein
MRASDQSYQARWWWRAALVALTFAAGTAGAQSQPPSDNELRAAYCIGVVQVELQYMAQIDALFRETVPADKMGEINQQRADTEQRLARLRAYLLPKLSHLDAVALTVAKQRADTDAALAKTEGDKLLKSCPIGPPLEALKCVTNAPTTEASSRLKACNDTSWLPF